MYDSPLSSHLADEHAAKLRTAADAVDEQSRRLDLRVDSVHFEGPAGRRFRAAMAERHQRAQRTVHRLQELAARVSGSAAHE
jgi:uncharacterized protein YukE